MTRLIAPESVLLVKPVLFGKLFVGFYSKDKLMCMHRTFTSIRMLEASIDGSSHAYRAATTKVLSFNSTTQTYPPLRI